MDADVIARDIAAGRLALRLDVEDFHAGYAQVLDRGDLADWPGFFVENCVYRITGRENWDAGRPIGILYCDSRAMLEDRVFAIRKTAMYAPRTVLHFISNVRVTSSADAGTVTAEANFLLVENLIDRNPRLLMAGCYFDRFQREGTRLLIKERHCVYDTLTVQTSLVYPV
jgi:3-phenylpropionate/cinnamic acid dioxygenase small subunit